MSKLTDIFKQEVSDLEKVRQGFDLITRQIIEQSEHEIELLRAAGNKEAMVHEQIKMSTIQHARTIFSDCYQLSTRKEAPHDIEL